jgi:hypothetical protein
VFEIPAGPGVDQRGGRQEIALVVVASAIGKDEVFDSINTAANTRYEVVGIRCPAKRLATVKAAPGLQVGQTFAQRLGRGQPVLPEKVAAQVGSSRAGATRCPRVLHESFRWLSPPTAPSRSSHLTYP